MEHVLEFDIQRQPDLTTCGPTCLQAVYGFFGDPISLSSVIEETRSLPEGGTLAVMLGLHALRRGYRARIFTYDLKFFDPTWFPGSRSALMEKLRQQLQYKQGTKFRLASEALIQFLAERGEVRMEDLSGHMLLHYLKRSIPILAGLSATYLYNEKREITLTGEPDDIRGEPQGHFVVLCGLDVQKREVLVADPLPNRPFRNHFYSVPLGHVISAIMLGILTYDANLLVIEPGRRRKKAPHETTHHP